MSRIVDMWGILRWLLIFFFFTRRSTYCISNHARIHQHACGNGPGPWLAAVETLRQGYFGRGACQGLIGLRHDHTSSSLANPYLVYSQLLSFARSEDLFLSRRPSLFSQLFFREFGRSNMLRKKGRTPHIWRQQFSGCVDLDYQGDGGIFSQEADHCTPFSFYSVIMCETSVLRCNFAIMTITYCNYHAWVSTGQ